jgi:DNA-binding NarL/FixJ family response regulator
VSHSMKQAKRILIVDDNSTVRTMVREALEMHMNVACHEAENGLGGVQRARELRPHLVIMDWAMPVMNGFEAAVLLRREMPEVPVVLLTIYSDLMELVETACVKAIIAKSDGVTALIECVQNVLGLAPTTLDPWCGGPVPRHVG